MSSDVWLDDNNRYLGASLRWLRLKLQSMASPVDDPLVVDPVALPTPRRRWLRFGPAPTEPVEGRRLLTATTGSILDAVARAAAEREEAARIEPEPALMLLAGRLGLNTFERDTILMCAAADLDPGMGALFAAAQGGGTRGYPTFGLALQSLDDPTWEALSPHRPLRYARMLELSQPGATPLTASALRADERIVNYLKGINALDERLAALVAPSWDGDATSLSASQDRIVDEILGHLRAAATDSRIPLIQLVGPDPASKVAVATRLCATLDRRLYRISLEALPVQKADLENLARLWQRESMLLAVALYIDAEEIDNVGAELASAFQWFVSRELGLVFVGQRETSVRDTGGGYVALVEKPSPREQFEAWTAVLAATDNGGNGIDHEAQSLAGQFDLNLRDIRTTAQAALRDDTTDPPPERVWDACRRLTQPRLDVLAERLEPKATWDEIVLAPEATSLLHQIVGQVRERFRVYEEWGFAHKMTRGLGISALFTGETGTGKTMAAEVIANELRLALYRIDLSAVVSKYIGETEKNLRKLFDAAESGGAILFFDEADALFGKRSEVKDSHDRYANIEINYLLQRMEAFSGLAILATNMKSALDNAFMRRLRFIVSFQFPGPAERQEIWRKALPPDVPREELDYERLARFSLSGGNIHSIALNAAFAAAGRGAPVSQPLIQAAVRTELRKLERPVNEAEFR